MVKKNNGGMIVLNVLLSVFVLVALIDTATTRIFDFNLILWISFGSTIAETVIAGIVGVFGLIGLATLLAQSIMMLMSRK